MLVGWRVTFIGVLFRLVWLNIDGFHWFRWGVLHLSGKPIYFSKRPPMVTFLSGPKLGPPLIHPTQVDPPVGPDLSLQRCRWTPAPPTWTSPCGGWRAWRWAWAWLKPRSCCGSRRALPAIRLLRFGDEKGGAFFAFSFFAFWSFISS